MNACAACGGKVLPPATLCTSCDAELGNESEPEKPSAMSSAVHPSDARADWVVEDSDRVVRCRKCGKPHEPGVFRCFWCDTSLRPIWLGIVTVAGPILLVIQSIFISGGFDAPRGLALALLLLMQAVQFAVLIGLRFGRNWAWIAIQIVWLVNLTCLIVATVRVHGSGGFVTFYAAVVVVHWIYIHRPGVRAFCSVGRDASRRR
jgi:hypothetical protein